MKKKSCLLIAFLMVMLQAVSIFAVVPASAASLERNYNIYKADEAVTVDGVAEACWSFVPYSQPFVIESNVDKGNTKFEAKFKVLWAPVENDATKMNAYFLLEVLDNTPQTNAFTGMDKWKCDTFFINLYIGETRYWTGQTNIAAGSTFGLTNNAENIDLTSGTVDNRMDEKNPTEYYTIEFMAQLPVSETIKFDLCIQDNYLGNTSPRYIRYSWNGTYGTGEPHGVGKILQETVSKIDTNADVLFENDGQVVLSQYKNAENTVVLPTCSVFGTLLGWKDAEGKMYPVGGTYTVSGTDQIRLSAVVLKEDEYGLLSGAAILIDNPSAMRFDLFAKASTMAKYEGIVQEKGIVVVQTSLLTEAILADGTITVEELDAAQIAYQKIVCTTADANGNYSAVIENIADASVEYSACSYMTLKYSDDSVHTVTGTYTAEDNCRSVKSVSEMAYADRVNVRGTNNGVSYSFKVSKDYAVGDFTVFSYSPYTKEQLDLLAEFQK